MRRQLMGVMLTALVLVGGVFRAEAAERTGSIRVTMDDGDGREQGAAVILYYVGQPSAEGYRLTDSFGGGIIRYEDDQSPALARWLAEAAGMEGMERIVDADGSAEFADLQEGLYLLTQNQGTTDRLPVSPRLIPIPCEEQWDLNVEHEVEAIMMESPKTGQHPAPIIGAMGLVLTGMGLVICFEKIRKK